MKEAVSRTRSTGEPSDESRIGVVVLNHNDYASSITCVRSLLGCVPCPGRIIVVDNASGNESAAKLAKEFGNSDRVEIVVSPVNGGYSAGNNLGIAMLRDLGFEHVVIATSDTEVISTDLFRRLEDAIGPGVGIVSPQILGPEGPENPSVDSLSLRYIVDQAWIHWGMPGLRLRRWVSQRFRRLRPTANARAVKTSAGKEWSRGTTRKVYKVHGAFLCLTASFLSKFGKLDEAIFMFGEEDLLAWQCLSSKLSQLVMEDTYVRHAHDSSVDKTWGTEAQAFVDRQQKASCSVLRRNVSLITLIREWIDGRSLGPAK